MVGLALGLAFLSSFGVGLPSTVIWVFLALLSMARSSLSPLAAVAIVAASIGGAAWAQLNVESAPSRVQTGEFEGSVEVKDGPFLTPRGLRFVVTGADLPGLHFCVYSDSLPRPHTGDTLAVSGNLIAPVDVTAIGRAVLKARDCDGQLWADSVVITEAGSGLQAGLSRFRTDLSGFLSRAAPGDAGALMSGLVTGDDGALTDATSDAFLTSGTTHITAISGANFAVLTMLLSLVATGGMRRSLLFIGIATAVIWCYALMVGLQPSAFRAALLATAVLVGRWLGRIPDLLTLTLLLASLQILVRPEDFDTLAFQLSIAATIALILVFDGSERAGNRPWLVSLALAVVAAQLATIPILAARIGTMSGIGVIANVIIGPLATIAFPLALFGGLLGLVVPLVGESILLPAVWSSELMIALVRWADRYLPGTVQLGHPVPATIVIITGACWTAILALSGDLRRMCRHGWEIVRRW